MAKAKTTAADEFEPAPGFAPGFVPAAADPDPDPAVEALRAELADVRARLAAYEAAPAAAGPEPAAAPGRFLVKLQDGPAWVVEAASAAHAPDAYRAATGVISSAHPFEVHPTEAPAGRAG